MKKQNLFLALLTLGGGLFLSSCDEKAFLNNEETFSLQAVSSMKLLSAANFNSNKMQRNNSFTEEEKQALINMLPQLDLFLNNGISIKSSIVEKETTINERTFTHVETISFTDNNLENTSYTLYYNIDKSLSNSEKDDGEIESETLEIISGYAKFTDDENYYEFLSYTETESEHDETEVERTFKIYQNKTNNTYIEVKQENENESNEVSTEFEYRLVENGRTTLNYSVEIENKHNKDKIEYEFNNQEYEITRYTKDNESYYQVKYENEQGDNDYEVLALVKKIINEDGTISYVFVE